jgi:hypothetical protein
MKKIPKQKSLLTCGSCSGLERDRLISGSPTRCSGQGKLPSSKICSSFKPDVFALAPLNSNATYIKDPLDLLATSIADFTISELQVLAALLLGEKKTRKYGFRFWQVVYVRLVGSASSNYLHNFGKGRILDANKEYIRVISETGKTCIQVVNDKDSNTLFTLEQFKPLRNKMVREKLIDDPALTKPKVKITSNILESIDFAVEADQLSENFTKKNRKVRKSQEMDLVSIVKKMASGRMLKRKKSDSYYDDSEISIDHF